MSEGVVRTIRFDHVLEIEVDRAEKMNGFTPEMFDALSDAFMELEQDDSLWVGVLVFAGAHTTAGLDLPRFADPLHRVIAMRQRRKTIAWTPSRCAARCTAGGHGRTGGHLHDRRRNDAGRGHRGRR